MYRTLLPLLYHRPLLHLLHLRAATMPCLLLRTTMRRLSCNHPLYWPLISAAPRTILPLLQPPRALHPASYHACLLPAAGGMLYLRCLAAAVWQRVFFGCCVACWHRRFGGCRQKTIVSRTASSCTRWLGRLAVCLVCYTCMFSV